MKKRFQSSLVLLCWLSTQPARAQESTQLEQLKVEVRRMQEQFQQQQREAKENFEKLIREQQAQIELLKKQLGALQNAPQSSSSGAPPNSQVQVQPKTSLEERKPGPPDPAPPQPRKSFVSEMNPGMAFVGDTLFSYTTRGQSATGADRPGGADAFLRSAELQLDATVDPFARAYGVLNASADAHTGEATLGLEEASVVTTSLPWNLTVQGGRFFADFGKLASVHPHDLPFVHSPLVLNSYIGGESRTDGLQVNYLLPTDHYINLTVGAGNSFGGDAGPNQIGGFRSLNELNTWTHLTTYFDLSSSMSLETGLSGLLNDRAESRSGVAERRRRVVAAELTLRYQPLDTGLRRGWVWGTEAFLNSAAFDRDPDGVPANGDEFRANERAFGLYSYLETKLSRTLRSGFLFDWVQDAEHHQKETLRYSPYVTYHPSEFQILRLQYSHTSPNTATGLRESDAIYLQWQFILGRHVHGFEKH